MSLGTGRRYTCTYMYTNFTLPGLRNIIAPALNYVTVDNIIFFGMLVTMRRHIGRDKKYKSNRKFFFETDV